MGEAGKAALKNIDIKIGPDGYFFEDGEGSCYIDGTQQTILYEGPHGLHAKDACAGEHCVIHNPSEHSMRSFPTLWRGDRHIMERICPHGVGHPDPDHIAAVRALRGEEAARVDSVHGCDGCCRAS